MLTSLPQKIRRAFLLRRAVRLVCHCAPAWTLASVALGKWFEEGTELSVGDWQKIALDRALLRPAQIMVLDEPTSALDAAAEYEVFQKFRPLTQGRAPC